MSVLCPQGSSRCGQRVSDQNFPTEPGWPVGLGVLTSCWPSCWQEPVRRRWVIAAMESRIAAIIRPDCWLWGRQQRSVNVEWRNQVESGDSDSTETSDGCRLLLSLTSWFPRTHPGLGFLLKLDFKATWVYANTLSLQQAAQYLTMWQYGKGGNLAIWQSDNVAVWQCGKGGSRENGIPLSQSASTSCR